MKNYSISLFVCLLTTIASAQTERYDTIQYAKEHYLKRVELFRSEKINKGRIVFLGNSITEFGDWQKLLNDSTVVNRGVAGDNTFGVLSRLDDIINRQPGKLFLKIGINDISQNIPAEIIIKNISAIIERVLAASPTTKIYLHSILPTNDDVKNEYPDAYNKNNIVKLVNSRLKSLSKKYSIIYIDIYRLFRDKNDQLEKKYADADGLHLNDLAYKTWIQLLKRKKHL